VNPKLLQALDRFVEHFRSDPRCLGMCLHGSIGRGETDEYSDVDVSIVVKDAHYAEVRAELRPLCEDVCGRIVVWLPEGEQENYCNHAFLYDGGDDELLLTDFEVVAETKFKEMAVAPDRILFDHTGLLASIPKPEAPAPLAAAELAHLIDTYWVYASLDGKYFRRDDLYKMLYVQGVLFQMHVLVLRAFHPGVPWTWWAANVQHLDELRREELLVYFGAHDIEMVCEALATQLSLFSTDARRACALTGIEYPSAVENAVRAHLRDMGALWDEE
jgi:hypothetical protein